MTATKYFRNAFAIAGDVADVPDDTQPSGTVSYEQGFPIGYELVQTDPASLDIPRNQTNQLYLDITSNIQQYQQVGSPNFITTAQNAGSPYPYGKYATVTYDDGINGARRFMSKKNTNTSLPTVKADWLFIDNTSGAVVIDNAAFDGAVVQGNAVYYDSASATFKQALANGAGPQKIIGFADVTFARVFTSGFVGFLSGLTAGQTYYLSTTTPGAITNIIPATNVVSVGFSKSATELMINLQLDSYNPESFFTSVIATNGYEKNNLNGRIMQWGKGVIPAPGFGVYEANVAITFPIPFPTAVFSTTSNILSSPGAASGQYLDCSISVVSLSGANFRVNANPLAPGVSSDFSWIAIGN